MIPIVEVEGPLAIYFVVAPLAFKSISIEHSQFTLATFDALGEMTLILTNFHHLNCSSFKFVLPPLSFNFLSTWVVNRARSMSLPMSELTNISGSVCEDVSTAP